MSPTRRAANGHVVSRKPGEHYNNNAAQDRTEERSMKTLSARRRGKSKEGKMTNRAWVVEGFKAFGRHIARNQVHSRITGRRRYVKLNNVDFSDKLRV